MKSFISLVILIIVVFVFYYLDQKQKGNEIVIMDYVVLEADLDRQNDRNNPNSEDEKNFIGDKANNFIDNTNAIEAFKPSTER